MSPPHAPASPMPDERQPSHIPRPRFFAAIAVVAAGAAAFAILFRASVSLLFERVFHAADVLAAISALPSWARIAVPAAGGLLAGLASTRASRHAGGQGVGDVMEAVVVGGRPMSLAATSWKAVGAWCAIVSGGSIGREGPLIQFGGAFGARIAEALRISEARRRALIAAGTAAGFAAAYNTPFAAVLFVTEVITGIVAPSIILPVMIAVAIATTLTRLAVGAGPIYGARAFTMKTSAELGLHLAVGVLGALVGVAFMRTLRASERTFQRMRPVHPALRTAFGGACVGALACALPAVTGNGYEAIGGILADRWPLWLVGALLVGKVIATASSVGSGAPGGVFTPSLFLGAALGALVAGLASRFVSIGAVGGYALVGMAAVVAATTHAPIMASVLVFELSGDYEIVLPLLIATAAATAISRKISPASIYVEELERKGLRWEINLAGRTLRRDVEDDD